MNGIKIYSENYINGDNTYTFVSGDTSESYLYDQKQSSQWVSVGSYNDKDETIEIEFKNWQGETVERTIDTIILLNHNIKNATMEYWGGSAWNAWSGGSLVLNTETSNILTVTKVTTSKIKFKPTTNQSAVGEKQIGELKVCESILEPSWLSDYPMTAQMKAGNYRNAEGSLIVWKEYTKQAGILSIDNIEKDDLDIMLPYLETAQFITIVFYNDFDLTHTYEFALVNAPNFNLNRKTQLSSMYLDLQER